ncbi:hypothetical protein EIP91_003750 [Steccherinum ochraceum]|uniref:Uncharacterized protein n=1 Tax=Steccherinum ochraceum TaxID=92696 RepID=A0A4V2MW34_9APHY|nr:hypothetical protein EIP91_003750 [Steccherinum ochraceum]
MNFTLDDTSSELVYSTNQWSTQPTSGSDSSQFFQETYHVAVEDGAKLNMSISGSAFALYGSKGPGHGNFSVQYDDAIIYLSAYSEQSSFQQVLYSQSFDAKHPSPHFVSLTAILNGDGIHGSWLDFDYITVSTGSSSPANTGGGIPVTDPPWQTQSSTSSTSTSSASSSSQSTGSAGANSTDSQDSKSASKVPTILAAVFGALVGLILVGLVVYHIFRRMHDSRRARERSFRYGNSSISSPSIATRTRSLNGSTVLLSLAAPGGDNSAGSATGKANNTHALTPPSSPGYGAVVHGQGVANEKEGRTAMTTSAVNHAAVSGATPGSSSTQPQPSQSTPFAFLSTAPTLPFNLGRRRDKGDADSLRTDFLQFEDLPPCTATLRLENKAMAVELATEIKLLIVEHLHDDAARSAMQALSLASHEWLVPAQMTLFQGIILDIQNAEVVEKFISFLVSTPHIADYISKLTIRGRRVNIHHPPGYKHENLLVTDVIRILSALPNLHSLAIRKCTLKGPVSDTLFLSHIPFGLAISLCLADVSVFHFLLSQFRGEYLHLSRIDFINPYDIDKVSVDPAFLASVRILELGKSHKHVVNLPHKLSEHILSTISFALRVNVEPVDVFTNAIFQWRYALRLLASAPRTLTRVSVMIMSDQGLDAPAHLFTLGSVDWTKWTEVLRGFPKLRYVEFGEVEMPRDFFQFAELCRPLPSTKDRVVSHALILGLEDYIKENFSELHGQGLIQFA